MSPFSAFFLLASGAVLHAQHNDDSASVTETKPVTSATAFARGRSFPAREVLNIKTVDACEKQEQAFPELCTQFPKLAMIGDDQNAWLELANKAALSFVLGFGQTELNAKSREGAVGLTTTQFFPQVLRTGLDPKNMPNTQKDFDAGKGYKSVAYDLRICSLGGRIRARVMDKAPIDSLGTDDAFAISEQNCEEVNFRTEPTVLSSVFTEIKNQQNQRWELLSQGQVGRVIGNKRYAGSVLNLRQVLENDTESQTRHYTDGAIGYCVGNAKDTLSWDEQCAKTGIIMDSLNVRAQLQNDALYFPQVSYIALSIANENNTEVGQSAPSQYELVTKDLTIAKGAALPTAGTLTLVGHQGEKVRMHFENDTVKVQRLNNMGELVGEVSVPAAALSGRNPLPKQ